MRNAAFDVVIHRTSSPGAIVRTSRTVDVVVDVRYDVRGGFISLDVSARSARNHVPLDMAS
jgi:hypothetical protein